MLAMVVPGSGPVEEQAELRTQVGTEAFDAPEVVRALGARAGLGRPA